MRIKTLVILLVLLISLVVIGAVAAATCEVVAPSAEDSLWCTPENTPIDITLSISGTISSVAAPSAGAATIIGPKTIRYTPNSGFTGTDGFSYMVRGCLQCSPSCCVEPAFVSGAITVVVGE